MLNQSAIARELGVSPATVTRMKRMGMPVGDISAARDWRRENIGPRGVKPQVMPIRGASGSTQSESERETAEDWQSTAAETTTQARARQAVADADMAELKLAEFKGQLVRVADVERIRSREHAMIKEAILQMRPRSLPLLAAARGNEAEIDRILSDMASEVLRIVKD